MRSEVLLSKVSFSGKTDSLTPDGPDKTYDVMGLRLHDLHRTEIADRVLAAVMSRQKYLVVNANAHLVTLAQSRPWLFDMFKAADLAFCDGAGVQLASRFLTGRTLHRTTPPEWIGAVADRLDSRHSVFWVGGKEETVERAATMFAERYGVRTAGTQHGFFDMAANSPANLDLIDRINQARPNLLLVNMGMPRQEQWLWENWHKLDPMVAVTAGALVDHVAGHVARPPRWVANLGVEWLVRLVREPRRLWRRYLLGLPVFAVYVARHAISRSARRSRSGSQSS